MEIIPSHEWHAISDEVAKMKGAAMLLGAVDTGKSTLAKFLVSDLCLKSVKVALVDADIGQSFLGPPTTIGFSLFSSPPDWENVRPREIFFVGCTSPDENLALHLAGVKKMADRAVSLGADTTIVDTTGLISGDFGKMLKRRKIALLTPRFIVALQRSGELEPILESYEGNPSYRIYRLSPAEQTRTRSREERAAYRGKKYKQYFETSQSRGLRMDDIVLGGRVKGSDGCPIPLEWALTFKGLLVGLKNDMDQTLALGLIEDYNEEKRTLRVATPLTRLKEVRRVQLSSLKLTPDYGEEKV